MKLIFNILVWTLMATALASFLSSCNKDKDADPQPQPVPDPAWYNLHFADSSGALHAVQLSGGGNVWVAADSGKIFRKSGSSSWIRFISAGTDFYGLSVKEAVNGWACGTNGTIAHTADGTDWSLQSSGVQADLHGIFFNSSTEGWVVGAPSSKSGAVILHTTDGGLNYEHQVSGTSNLLTGVYSIDSMAWACGMNGTILRTTDKGATWTKITLSVTNNLRKIYFLDTLNGLAAGSDGLLLRTSDGGLNWNIIPLNTLADLYDICFISQSMGWICGAQGKILHTADGGTTWSVMNSGTDAYLYSLVFGSDSTGYAAGVTKTGRGILLQYK